MEPVAVALLWAPLLSFVLGQVSGYITRRWWPGLFVGLAIMLLMAVALPMEARASAWPPIYLLAGLLGGGTGRSFRRLHERQ